VKRVLLVEDDALMRNTLARALVRRMPEVVVDTAVDREEAMPMLVAERYDCLIVDVCLGGSLEGPGRNVDGLAVVMEARRLWPDLPVIFVTGMDDFAETIDTEALNVLRVFKKPFETGELLELVARVVAGEDVRAAPCDKPLAEFEEENDQRKLEHVRRVLESNGWSKCAAAKRLDVDRRTVDRYVERLAERDPPVRAPGRKKA